MPIERKDVLHVAKLSRLELRPEEVEPMLRDLSRILDYVEELRALDTTSVEATAQVAVDAAPLREDKTHNSLAPQLALSESARHTEEGFSVPGFMDE
jgi:aspartyl-tRNA(Asn)/glutamyl-tRNA(Gln) amidotransferase subunit C